MYGYIYLMTNKVNGHKYIGQHAKPEFDNDYYGSGTNLIKAFNKYGKENFTREILAWAETKEELDRLEIELIGKYDAVNSDEYYNIVPGGSGVGSGELHPRYGKHHTEETKRRISESLSGENSLWLGKHFSEEHKIKIKISEANKGHQVNEETRNKISGSLMGRQFSEETKRRISESLSGEINPNCRPVVQLTISGGIC